MYKSDSVEVLNLFNNKLGQSPEINKSPPIPEKYLSSYRNDDEVKRREKEALMKQLERFDENVKHAILLRREKDNKTEFYRRLETLTERISAYKSIFCFKEPSFITINNKFKCTLQNPSEHSSTKKASCSYILIVNYKSFI